MQVSVQVSIDGSREAIWKTITDFENCADWISAIEKMEILEKPDSGLVGLKWRETRTMFGKTATEEMWITSAVENESYDVRAESHGTVYESTLGISDGEDGRQVLTMVFGAEPQGMVAKLMSALMGWMFKGATVKALQGDLDDIKAHVESSS